MENNLQETAIKVLAGVICGALLAWGILTFRNQADTEIIDKIETIKSIVCE